MDGVCLRVADLSPLKLVDEVSEAGMSGTTEAPLELEAEHVGPEAFYIGSTSVSSFADTDGYALSYKDELSVESSRVFVIPPPVAKKLGRPLEDERGCEELSVPKGPNLKTAERARAPRLRSLEPRHDEDRMADRMNQLDRPLRSTSAYRAAREVRAQERGKKTGMSSALALNHHRRLASPVKQAKTNWESQLRTPTQRDGSASRRRGITVSSEGPMLHTAERAASRVRSRSVNSGLENDTPRGRAEWCSTPLMASRSATPRRRFSGDSVQRKEGQKWHQVLNRPETPRRSASKANKWEDQLRTPEPSRTRSASARKCGVTVAPEGPRLRTAERAESRCRSVSTNLDADSCSTPRMGGRSVTRSRCFMQDRLSQNHIRRELTMPDNTSVQRSLTTPVDSEVIERLCRPRSASRSRATTEEIELKRAQTAQSQLSQQIERNQSYMRKVLNNSTGIKPVAARKPTHTKEVCFATEERARARSRSLSVKCPTDTIEKGSRLNRRADESAARQVIARVASPVRSAVRGVTAAEILTRGSSRQVPQTRGSKMRVRSPWVPPAELDAA